MSVAYISEIELPSGTTYKVKDEEARNAKAWLGITTTPLTDGSTTNPITIGTSSVTAKSGDITSYQETEFIFNGSKWQEFGNLSDLGSLAYQNSASGTFTPEGNVSKPSVTVTESKTDIPNVTNVGSMPTYTVSGEKLTISAGSTPTLGTAISALTGATAALDDAPTFTGTSGSVTVS